MTRENFITEQYIKDNSPITYNVDMKMIFSNVETAENMFTQEILGSEFYEDLITKLNDQTLNTDEIILVQDYIKPAVLWRSIELSIPFLSMEIRNKGLMKNTDDNATQADFRDMVYLRNETKNRAEFQENFLVKYLCKYSSLFPLYKTQDGLIDPDNSTNWDSGLIMY